VAPGLGDAEDGEGSETGAGFSSIFPDEIWMIYG